MEHVIKREIASFCAELLIQLTRVDEPLVHLRVSLSY